MTVALGDGQAHARGRRRRRSPARRCRGQRAAAGEGAARAARRSRSTCRSPRRRRPGEPAAVDERRSAGAPSGSRPRRTTAVAALRSLPVGDAAQRRVDTANAPSDHRRRRQRGRARAQAATAVTRRGAAFWTLPISLRGSSSSRCTTRGRLCGVSSEATWSASSSARRLGALGGHDPGDDPLAEVGVGLAGDRRLAHAGVLEQRALDLARADLEAAALDEVGGAPPDDADVAVGRAGGEVAGAKPAVAQRLGGGVGAVEVLQEEVRPAHGDLADRLVVGGVDRARRRRRAGGSRRRPAAARRTRRGGRRRRGSRCSSASRSSRSARRCAGR